jgi:hypothetical protein
MYGTRTRFVLVHIVPMSKHFECLARIVKQTRGIAFAIDLVKNESGRLDKSVCRPRSIDRTRT